MSCGVPLCDGLSWPLVSVWCHVTWIIARSQRSLYSTCRATQYISFDYRDAKLSDYS